jgi:hypothetical protein
MDIVDRIGSCRAFVEGKCPCQSLMERVYLVPQLMNARDLRDCDKACCTCDKGSSPHR